MQPSSLDQLVGQKLGAYRVERMLARGHVNAVYLAYNATENSPVALVMFMLSEKFSLEARRYFLLRFRQEATKLTTLQQSHILPVYDYGEYAGFPYLVTPYMTNGSLADVLEHRGRFHYADVLPILQQVVTGLAHAHAKGIFHGALKPANIVLNNQQQMLVAGFGLTQILQRRGMEQDGRPYEHLFNIAGTFLTAAEYLAPEVVEGQPADARTDIYSLGVILFELLSGQTPFTGTNPLEVAMKHVQQPVLSLHTQRPDLPLALAAVVNQALDRDPARRFQHVYELAEAFAQVSAALPGNGTNNTVAARRSVELQETPAVGYVFGNWQLLPPIMTDKVVTVKPPAQQTNKQELASLAPLAKVSPPSVEALVAATPLLPLEPAMQNSPEALYDLWTAVPQGSSPPRRPDAAQSSVQRAERRSTAKPHARRPTESRQARVNERISRRKVVALLAAGGVVAAGAVIAINLAGHVSNQQAQNNAANLAKNAAMNFVNPTNGKASVLVHLANGNFVAYDRACTHAQVYVAYDPAQQLLVCPAHGATFDPAQDGAVRQGPATQPLPKVSIHINADGTITA